MCVGDKFLKNLKMFMQEHCSILALVGSQIIFRNFSIPIWGLFLSFKQNRMHLFWEIWIFLAKSLLRFAYYVEHA